METEKTSEKTYHYLKSILKHRVDFVKCFTKHGIKHRDITEAVVREAVLNYKNKRDLQFASALLCFKYDNLIQKEVNKFVHTYSDAARFKEDLYQQALEGVYTAANRFDLERPNRDGGYIKFSTCAFLWIRQKIKTYYEKYSKDLRIPPKLMETRKRIMDTMKELEIETPCLNDADCRLIGDLLGLDKEQVNEAYNLTYASLRSDGSVILDELEAPTSSKDLTQALQLLMNLYSVVNNPRSLFDMLYARVFCELVYLFVSMPNIQTTSNPREDQEAKLAKKLTEKVCRKNRIQVDELKNWIHDNQDLFADVGAFDAFLD